MDIVIELLLLFTDRLTSIKFIILGRVKSGLPSFNFPSFRTVHKNQTYNFFEMCSHLGSGIVILPLVSVLANVAIAKVFGKINRKMFLNTNFNLCGCYIIGPFFQPVVF